MKKTTLLLVFIYAVISANAQSKQQLIANQITFAKLYGYVKYFYPGDEAAAVNWDNFAIYGAKKVANCADKEALKQTLQSLFSPIVPTLQLVDSDDGIVFNKQSIIPSSLSGYRTIAWQHVGGRARPANYDGDPFRSARTNRPIYLEEYSQKMGVAVKGLDVSPYRGKKFTVKGRAKVINGKSQAQVFAAVDLADRAAVSYDNVTITSNQWADFEMKGEVNLNGKTLRIGPFLLGTGELWVDNLRVDVQDGDGWKNIYLNDFSKETTGVTHAGILGGYKPKPDPDFSFNIIEATGMPGEKWLAIKSETPAKQRMVKHTTFFKAYPKVGEYITKDIGSGLRILMPIALYGNETNTYPVADNAKKLALNNALSDLSFNYVTADSLATRFANLIIIWNQFQHFFPYFDVAKTDWTQDLSGALTDALNDKSSYDFLRTLRKFTAKLKDEHIRVSWDKDQNAFLPAITWEWIENKLVVTKVLDKSLPIKAGDVITTVDNQAPEDHFQNIKKYIAAASPGGLTDRAQTESLVGGNGTTLQLSFLNRDNVPGNATLIRNRTYPDHYNALGLRDSVKQVTPDIIYLDIAVINIKTINLMLPQLQKSKAIICDLRNFRKDNWTTNHFIEYLLTKKDTATHWMKNARIIYPDQERISGYETEGFDLVPAKPHLNAKIIFLVDGTAYSWAESYMSIIAHYKLATIVGQPTAGTNGDVNQLSLPGGYQVSYSGLKITQLDLSPHQGVGTKPDVYVNKTIKGVREGRDEFLDKAIEIANQVN